MKRDYLWKSFLLLLMGCLGWAEAFSQQISISGTVKDAAGEPVIGANILVKGTTQGTITDLDGKISAQEHYAQGNRRICTESAGVLSSASGEKPEP